MFNYCGSMVEAWSHQEGHITPWGVQESTTTLLVEPWWLASLNGNIVLLVKLKLILKKIYIPIQNGVEGYPNSNKIKNKK